LQGSPADAVVSIAGTKVGPAAGFRPGISAGPHDLEISADRYQTLRESVTIPTGGEKNTQFALALLPGTLSLRGSPANAVLTIDGKRIGPAAGSHQISAGNHEVEISAKGYKPDREEVTVPAGEVKSLDFALATQPLPPSSPSKRQQPTPHRTPSQDSRGTYPVVVYPPPPGPAQPPVAPAIPPSPSPAPPSHSNIFVPP